MHGLFALIVASLPFVQALEPLPSTSASLTIAAAPERDFSRTRRSSWDTLFMMTAKNLSGEPIELRKAGFWPNHIVILRDDKGNELPLTPLGRAMRKGATHDYLVRDHNDALTLSPGNSFEYGLPFDLRRLYDPQPGTYSLTVEYRERIGGPVRIVSNPLTIVVPATE